MSTDNRPDAEIQFGAALNVVEPLEADLDELVLKVITEPCFPPDMTRELAIARHHIFAIRHRLTWVFERTTRNSLFLRMASELSDGHTAMKQAREHVQSMIGSLENAQRMIASLGGSWKYDDLWQKILRRMEDMPTKIIAADISLTIADLTATD